ncbi:unnamed protein product [Spirodela intermedia]|uniref:Uncharacterized protein n=2 Tax=Spirodela intermedia TaxID=51605 RepID=A0A7I8JJL3_SPIIN|nr:unnamed protein product [Spirodela intermedia]CAA6670319.1 unnamed protein product [Spirodela intermedia]CAA7407377.1 unnamed protein product [Spirodela intermedia]
MSSLSRSTIKISSSSSTYPISPVDAPESGSTTLSSAFLTTVPQDPCLVLNGSLANPRLMERAPASVIP